MALSGGVVNRQPGKRLRLCGHTYTSIPRIGAWAAQPAVVSGSAWLLNRPKHKFFSIRELAYCYSKKYDSSHRIGT